MHTARNKKSESVVRAKQNARKWVILIKHINLVALVKYEYLWPDRQINYNTTCAQELIAICAARQGHSLQKWENLNNCESRIASRVEGILYFLELVLRRLFKISA